MLNKLITKGSKFRETFQTWYFDKYIPTSLSKNFISLDKRKTELLNESLVKNVYSATKAIDSPEIQQLISELEVRLRDHRAQIVPWLESIKPLKGLRILEIGCGNGTSTVALAEQGAIVTAIDIEESLLRNAEERCQIYGVSATFHLMNATEVSTVLAGEAFDMILFYAVLEHMTYTERLIAIRQTFDMLSNGGLWCVIGTPNRLTFYDSHTAMMPFFYWLPDELAIKYASLSPRREFGERFVKIDEPTEEMKLEFARWGRGMSYHEFELALGPLNELTILSSLGEFLRKRDLIYKLASSYRPAGRYASFFRKLYPQINEAFFDPYLDMIIQK